MQIIFLYTFNKPYPTIAKVFGLMSLSFSFSSLILLVAYVSKNKRLISKIKPKSKNRIKNRVYEKRKEKLFDSVIGGIIGGFIVAIFTESQWVF